MDTLTKAGRYELVGELGRGAMGVVYRAVDPVIGRTVAVKTIRLSEEGTGMSRQELLQRIQTEARAAGLLTHPNIVVVYDAGEEDGLYYITMELVEGKSLFALMEEQRRFPLQRALRIMEQACSALQFAHERSVVHRDIKPANLIITGEDTLKITDFGMAKILQSGAMHQSTNVMGTPGYMSPEQVKGQAVDGRSDIFSLGVMFYEMMTGEKPFPGPEVATVLYQIISEEPTPPQSVNLTIHPGINYAIMKALTKDRDKRYQSCRELLEDLRNYRTAGRSPNVSAVLKPPSPSRTVAAPAPSERRKTSFQAEMPRLPGLEPTPQIKTLREPTAEVPGLRVTKLFSGITTRAAWAAGLALAAIFVFFVVKSLVWPKQSDSEPAATTSTLQVSNSSPQGVSTPGPPVVSRTRPEIASIDELATPWSSKEFFFQSLSASTDIPALIIRLPGGAATQNNFYWAFSLEVPYSRCRFEYIEDLAKLSSDYGIQAKHPMVANPCTRSIFDPLRLKELPGNTMVRGEIVQGSDIRPPYQIEVKISGNQIQALRME